MAKRTAKEQRKVRRRRISVKVRGTKERPRLSVFRSNQHLYAQLVDDSAGKVLAAVSDLKLKEKKSGIELAGKLGEALAKKAKEQGVAKAVFDRGGYKWHGRIAALAEGARKAGLTI